jgi:hypothetical protein
LLANVGINIFLNDADQLALYQIMAAKLLDVTPGVLRGVEGPVISMLGATERSEADLLNELKKISRMDGLRTYLNYEGREVLICPGELPSLMEALQYPNIELLYLPE